MNVLLLVDERFVVTEHAMLQRLETGLADEGVRVVHALPDSLDPDAMHASFATQVFHSRDSGLVPRRVRAKWLLQRVASALGQHDGPRIDVVHVYGESLWPLGLAVAARAEAPLALEAWSVRSVEYLARLESSRLGVRSATLLLADEGFAERARARGATWRLTPWGVHARPEPAPVLPQNRAPGIVLMGFGVDRRGLRRALEGIAAAIKEIDLAMVFTDHDAAHTAGLWSLARELNLRDRLSLIPELEGDRQLVLRNDILVVPEPVGELHSLALDAMGAGMAVVAAHDPALSLLRDKETALVISSTGAEDWAGAIRTLLESPEEGQRVARGAWAHVREHRRASAHVTAVLDTYEWLTATDALPFSAEGP